MRAFENIGRLGLYRSRNGVILGVCRGLAEYFDFSVFWVRFIILIVLFCSGLWPIAGLYFIAALLMKPEPVLPIQTYDEQEFYDSYIHSKGGAVHRLKRRYDNLDRRVQRMEDVVTSREFDWDRRLNGV
jgi:phage shock protein C